MPLELWSPASPQYLHADDPATMVSCEPPSTPRTIDIPNKINKSTKVSLNTPLNNHAPGIIGQTTQKTNGRMFWQAHQMFSVLFTTT
mmetsp:Transcript_7484/g.17141  ORF Transcript_7484/g.17141 Transcript_7484/m.17141 type:complete len:87 (-) Transcript_7484:1111-1371(-)